MKPGIYPRYQKHSSSGTSASLYAAQQRRVYLIYAVYAAKRAVKR